VRPSLDRKNPPTGDVPRVNWMARFSMPSPSIRPGAAPSAAAAPSPACPPPREPRPPGAGDAARSRSRTSGSLGSSVRVASETTKSWLVAWSRFEVKTTDVPSGVSAALVSLFGLCVTLCSALAAMS
jgi:hypothetical protein